MIARIAYKVLTSEEWNALCADEFEGSPIDQADGFIHLSTAAQLTETVERYFRGHEGLVIAAIDLNALGDSVRWETSRGGQRFPHFYGRLRPGHVDASRQLERHADGTVHLPNTSLGRIHPGNP
jgi:uncharacterized protein (DUF952 family)